MQPESSDGFASVGTILPKEEAALLPGGFFASADPTGHAKVRPKSLLPLMEFATQSIQRHGRHRPAELPKESPMHDVIVALAFIAMVMAPCVVALASNPDGPNSN